VFSPSVRASVTAVHSSKCDCVSPHARAGTVWPVVFLQLLVCSKLVIVFLLMVFVRVPACTCVFVSVSVSVCIFLSASGCTYVRRPMFEANFWTSSLVCTSPPPPCLRCDGTAHLGLNCGALVRFTADHKCTFKRSACHCAWPFIYQWGFTLWIPGQLLCLRVIVFVRLVDFVPWI